MAMKYGIHIGPEIVMPPETIAAITDALIRLIETRGDQATIRHAMDVLKAKVGGEVSNTVISNNIFSSTGAESAPAISLNGDSSSSDEEDDEGEIC